MKERPILFSGEMARAVLDGRKTQTRQPIKPQPELGKPWKWWVVDDLEMDIPIALCPYGIPGDRLWVREKFSKHVRLSDPYYLPPDYPDAAMGAWYWADGNPTWGDWEKPRPSIHMPRWASRITLEVTDVRVERVQEISYDDTLKEGVIETGNASAKTWEDAEISGVVRRQYVDSKGRRCMMFGAKAQFANLWDSIYSQRGYGWDANPWVWVVEFVASEDWR